MKRRMELGKNRIEALTDGVYAIALTIGVLSLDISELPSTASSGDFAASLSTVIPQVIYYGIAFFVLISFWMAHHRMMDYINRVDSTFIFTNVIALFFVALVPFTTDLMGYYDSYPLAVTLYAANLLIIGLLQTASWHHISSKKGLLREDATADVILLFKLRGIQCPLVAFIVIIFAQFVSADYATFLFLLIPVVGFIINKVSGIDMAEKPVLVE